MTRPVGKRRRPDVRRAVARKGRDGGVFGRYTETHDEIRAESGGTRRGATFRVWLPGRGAGEPAGPA